MGELVEPDWKPGPRPERQHRPLPARRATPRRDAHPVPLPGQIIAVALAAKDAVRFRDQVAAAAADRCQLGLSPRCPGWGAEVHHRWMRSQGGPDTLENARWLCGWCHHEVVHAEVDWARRHRWIVSPGHPLDPPVSCGLDCDDDHRPGVAA